MVKSKILSYLGRLALLAVALAAFWFWSNAQVEKRVKAECAAAHAQTQIETMVQERIEAKNVDVKKSVIYSRPNLGRNSLLNAMRAGQL